jgi:hypothetical protein
MFVGLRNVFKIEPDEKCQQKRKGAYNQVYHQNDRTGNLIFPKKPKKFQHSPKNNYFFPAMRVNVKTRSLAGLNHVYK